MEFMKNARLSGLLVIGLLIFGFRNHVTVDGSFSGNWKINLQKSEGGQSAPKAMKIKLTKDSIFIERITGDDQTFVEKMSFDGKVNICTTTSGRRKSGSAKWDEEGKAFTENATLGQPDDPEKVAFTVVEHWQLSEDQNQVTVFTKITNTSGANAQRKDVYDRQN
jgi:hypothetical protein